MSGSIRIVDMPDLGSITDASSFVGERAGSGRFSATALRSYITSSGSSSFSVLNYGARGDGVTDDSAAFQAAINAAVAKHGSVYIPAAASGYLINTPLNMANLNGLTVRGDGCANTTAFGFVYTGPTSGSVLIANTGNGKPAIDATGSSAITFADFSINALPASNASQIGFILGTSNGSQPGHPGGTGLTMERVGIFLKNTALSIPIYGNNVNISNFIGISTIGAYGLVLSTNNPLTITPPYAGFGDIINSDGNFVAGCAFLSYGTACPLYLEGCNFSTFDQVYVNTIFGGTSFSGQPYGIHIQDCNDLRMRIECDYFPSMAMFVGTAENIDLSGVQYAGTTTVAAGLPVVAFFSGTHVYHCRFDVKTYAETLSSANYMFTTVSTAPTMTQFADCDFRFDTNTTANLCYFNVATGVAVPYFNLRFTGSTDAVVYTMLVNGAAAAGTAQRYWLNGKLLGTA